MGLRKRAKQEGYENSEDAGKVWLKQQLPRLAAKIHRIEKVVKQKNSEASLRTLNELVNTYNNLLITIFGAEGSARIPNFRVSGNAVETYIPQSSARSQSNSRPKEQRPAQKEKPAQRDLVELTPEMLSRVGHDSDESGYRYLVDLDMAQGQPSIKLFYSDKIAVGTGYVAIRDPRSGEQFHIPFVLKDDLSFIKLVVDVFYANKYPIEIIAHKEDIKRGLIGPPNDRSGLN